VTITKADVLARCPEFASLADPIIPNAIADAMLQQSASWGVQANLAAIYLTGHILALEYPALVKNQVQSVSAGGVSKTYAVGQVDTSAGALGLTRYGREYLRLVRQRGFIGAVT
jgi:hypothetical protein